MNKLLGAMVLLFGVTSAAFSGSVAADIDKMSKAINCGESHILQIASLDDGQLSQLCAEIVDENNNNELKSALINQCKIKLANANGDIAEEIQHVIETK